MMTWSLDDNHEDLHQKKSLPMTESSLQEDKEGKSCPLENGLEEENKSQKGIIVKGGPQTPLYLLEQNFLCVILVWTISKYILYD